MCRTTNINNGGGNGNSLGLRLAPLLFDKAEYHGDDHEGCDDDDGARGNGTDGQSCSNWTVRCVISSRKQHVPLGMFGRKVGSERVQEAKVISACSYKGRAIP